MHYATSFSVKGLEIFSPNVIPSSLMVVFILFCSHSVYTVFIIRNSHKGTSSVSKPNITTYFYLTLWCIPMPDNKAVFHLIYLCASTFPLLNLLDTAKTATEPDALKLSITMSDCFQRNPSRWFSSLELLSNHYCINFWLNERCLRGAPPEINCVW